MNEVCSELQLSAISHDFMLEEMVTLFSEQPSASIDVRIPRTACWMCQSVLCLR